MNNHLLNVKAGNSSYSPLGLFQGKIYEIQAIRFSKNLCILKTYPSEDTSLCLALKWKSHSIYYKWFCVTAMRAFNSDFNVYKSEKYNLLVGKKKEIFCSRL